MEFKQLLSLSNLVVAALSRSMMKMGLSGELIVSQVASELASEDMQRGMMERHAAALQGKSSHEMGEVFFQALIHAGAIQKMDGERISDEKFKMCLGDCIFLPSCTLIRDGDNTQIPPCPWMSIFSSVINTNTDLRMDIDTCLYIPEKNMCDFGCEWGTK